MFYKPLVYPQLPENLFYKPCLVVADLSLKPGVSETESDIMCMISVLAPIYP